MSIFKKIVFPILFFIIVLSFNVDRVYADNTYTRGVVKGTSISVRTGAGTNYGLVKNDTGSSIYLSAPESVEVLSSSNGWYQIRFLYGGFYYTGFINGNYLTTTTVNIDSNYENNLKTKGFPSSYARKLSILHSLHPNWEFEAVNTNLDWNTVISSESYPVNKNLINSSNASLRSTNDGAYINGVYTQYGSGWYAASSQTISYFMDPRNFFDEGHIFMFEQLSYNPSKQTEQTVQQMLNSSFMKGSYSYNSTNFTFANTFIKAAQTHNVSPVHLASRALQEQGSNGSVLSLGNGYQGNYVGYYNFYNIGASGNNDYDIIMNGLKYAYNKGWSSQYLSIVNGSSLLGNSYIGVGQDTLYFEKFNTVNKKSLYSNQYMQNVKAAYSESYTTYTGYKNANLLESGYTFRIPVYNNMPDATTLSVNDNSDNTLKSLSVTGCDLNPSFISSATNYTCNVSNNISEVTVNATKSSEYSSMNGTGKVSLNSNITNINVVVTSANGSTKTYTIVVNKVQSGKETPADIISSQGYNNSNNIISGIKLGTDVSNIISNIKNKYSLSTVVVKNVSGTQIKNGLITTGSKITITNNNQTTEFTSVIYGDISGDGKIDLTDLLKVQKHIKGVSKLSGVYAKSADINKDGKVDLTDLLKVQKHIKGVSQIEQ